MTEILLFGVRGKDARTLAPGRRQVNIIKSMKREHSRKPDETYDVIEACSPGPRLELFGCSRAEDGPAGTFGAIRRTTTFRRDPRTAITRVPDSITASCH